MTGMATGEGGIVLPVGEGKALWAVGNLLTFKTTAQDTAGAYSLIEMTLAPTGTTPPPHRHPHTEAFYVLEGTLAIQVGERAVEAGAGAFVLAPGGVVHTFRNLDPKPARMLVIFSPAGFEGFFEELGGRLRPGRFLRPAARPTWSRCCGSPGSTTCST